MHAPELRTEGGNAIGHNHMISLRLTCEFMPSERIWRDKRTTGFPSRHTEVFPAIGEHVADRFTTMKIDIMWIDNVKAQA
jgi:hypothetical protein